ncbi:brefeldin A-inhibited guanine nucleotide-exchange protein 1-like isoform X1 [Telopea speciosissima]|uniref:brefeldin A-inhibited guanine nucleotide-exchange protein 1-like isoform X1 n=1 Tax=Telopea speciosissima TaxID=54955 RepID=UPI001CC33B36|nr:brefeldin A-inhibited guanine nucleotide-exchange protein 1-like isoform X1 [Telopea speciosissima]
MSSLQVLGGISRAGHVLGPSLDKIIKNVAWRKHAQLVAACKSVLDKLETIKDSPDPIPDTPIFGFIPADAEFVLQPLILAIESASVKVIEPALECVVKLFSQGLIRGEIDRPESNDNPSVLYRLIDSIFKCAVVGEDGIELAVLRALCTAVRSPCVLIRGGCLIQIVKICYNVYVGSMSNTNQICAKVVLAQILMIVNARVEEDSMDAKIRAVTVGGLLEVSDKSLNDWSLIQSVQTFIEDIVESSQGVSDLKLSISPSLKLRNGHVSGSTEEGKGEFGDGESVDREGSSCGSKIREDGFLLFKNLCKFSLKFPTQENPEDQVLLRGKVLSLELLKVAMDHASSFWRTDERFLSAIKQYLCLSLLKNSTLSVMTVFQLLCSIFMSLLSKFRSELKAEIGIFFPMLVLRVLENVLQPSFMQKMTVLNLLERISQDSQIIIDIFVNYDCDVDAPNIFERTVNGLVKTALGPPLGSTTTLTPAQDMAFRVESIKCLTGIIKSMGAWMDQQLRDTDLSLLKSPESDASTENHSMLNGEEGAAVDCELETSSELSEAASLEQRRAFKIEFQKGISLFNRKPSKGIEFLMRAKMIGGSPEEVASFLKNTTGLNETMIGDYLGEREEFPLKVMHAYVDSFNFEGKDFGEAIRFFLRGFRLPGEAQKIDRIMEKFAERYCKCNPNSFTSADTAYVLAYSVIMLNTDAHNSMVKDKMLKTDFIRNNRGIDDGKDLPEEYLGALYDQIVKNEIKMSADCSAPQNKQANSFNKLLGLDGLFNLINWKQTEEKPLSANGALIKHIQEQIKAKSGKSESVYYVVTDTAILRFMVEVCWAPMFAAFSVTLDQSDDKTATFQSLQGFRHAVHVTAVMGMQTQRDAFVTSMAKFTFLHCAADMKQKNVDAMKAIISIAIEDGNYLQEAWEHILTCLSRFEQLHLLGEGAPPDASFFVVSLSETEEKTHKSSGFPSLKKKGNALQNPAVMAVVRGGSYDSTTLGIKASALVTPDQINQFISNLNLLDQIGNFELNHIFAHSQRLNSEAIVTFVKTLCKVSMAELQSPTDPRVFSLTKIVEIAHYNMNRIRLVWSRIWSVLSDFFVAVGLSENLSVAIFVMDSLRQLAMKFLEREELANYNFQNEFLRPFVIVMQKSNSAEIRELIVRCVTQMVLSRVSNVKSGWKIVFTVFTTAAADERKNIVLLAFETMEKIVREYFPYITETETTTFTYCVKCLITFTNSRFNSDVSLNAIAFLRFCAVKLADGGLICYDKSEEGDSSIPIVDEDDSSGHPFTDEDDHVSFWVPLLTGLSKLTSDPRQTIRRSALEVLFNILKDHGHTFSQPFWLGVFRSVILPIFSNSKGKGETNNIHDGRFSSDSKSPQPVESPSNSEILTEAAQYLVDLFVSFFDSVRSQLPSVVSVLTGFISSPVQSPASTGVAALQRLAGDLGDRLSDEEWGEIFMRLKEAAAYTLPEILRVLKTMDDIEVSDDSQTHTDMELFSDHEIINDDLEDDSLQIASYVLSRVKGHIAVQLLIIQVITELYKAHHQLLAAANITVLLEIFSSVTSHAHKLNSETILQVKLRKVCSILEISDPPIVHFENESYQSYLNFLHSILTDNPSLYERMNIEPQLVAVCEEILQKYLNCSGCQSKQTPGNQPVPCWRLPLGSAKKEELAARTPLTVLALQVLSGLERDSFRRCVTHFFPLLVDLVQSEHSSGEVLHVLSHMFQSCIGPIIMGL